MRISSSQCVVRSDPTGRGKGTRQPRRLVIVAACRQGKRALREGHRQLIGLVRLAHLTLDSNCLCLRSNCLSSYL